MKRQWLVALTCIFSVALMACGSGSGGGSGAAKASCMSYCAAYIQKACADPIFTSEADCEGSECSELGAAPSGCQTKLVAYYDCRKGQADICADSACTSELAALSSC